MCLNNGNSESVVSLISLLLTVSCSLIPYKCYASTHDSLEVKVASLFREKWDKSLQSITTVGCMERENGASYSSYFMFMSPCIIIKFFIIKPNRCTDFTNLLFYEILHLSDSLSVHRQQFIHCTLSNGICHTGLSTAFEQDQDGTGFIQQNETSSILVLSIIRSLFTVHSAIVYVIQVCRQLSSRTRMELVLFCCLKAVYRPVWHIPLLSVLRINSWWWTDELSKTCSFMPK